MTWQKCLGTVNTDLDPSFCKASDGGYMVIATVNTEGLTLPGIKGGKDIILIKTDAKGNEEWSKFLGGSENELAVHIIHDGLDNYYITGWVTSTDGDISSYNHGGTDYWLVKIDGSGNILWEKCMGGSEEDYSGRLTLLSDGNIISYSATFSSDGDVGINYGYLDVWVFIFSPEGEVLNSRVFGNWGHNNVFDLVETRDGGFFMASKAYAGGMVSAQNHHGGMDVWALKLDRELNIVWQKVYGGSYYDYGLYGLKEMDNGYVFLAGTNSNDGDVSGLIGNPGSNDVQNIWMVRIDSVGELLWQKCFGNWFYSSANNVFPTKDGGYMVFGTSEYFF
ncbi:MAG: hypothetical protein CVU06_15830, partial [Bacteroidetes bacterium HGW-Bacteroidetes-22]